MKIIKIILKIFYILIFSKKLFFKPKKKDVLIFDKTGSQFIIPYLKEIGFEILDIRILKKISVNFYVIFINICRFKFSFEEYLKSYINFVEPKIIISFIDNNYLFYKLKFFYPNAKTIIIQNAWRSIKTDIFDNVSLKKLKSNKRNYCDFILSFNNKIGLMYKSFLKGKVISVGSIRSNAELIKKRRKIYNYIYISIFRPHIFLKPEDEVLLSSINKYFNEIKKKLYILGSSIVYSEEEKNFYSKHLKNINFIFIPKTPERKTYQIIDSSKIILSLESTLAYEALSRGNKVIFFSLRTNEIPDNGENFGWPYKIRNNGRFWTTRLDKEIIKDKINYLEKLSDADFKKILNKNVKNLINYDFDNLILKKLIRQFVKV